MVTHIHEAQALGFQSKFTVFHHLPQTDKYLAKILICMSKRSPLIDLPLLLLINSQVQAKMRNSSLIKKKVTSIFFIFIFSSNFTIFLPIKRRKLLNPYN